MDSVVSDDDASTEGQLGVDARASLDAVGLNVDVGDQIGQHRVSDRALRRRALAGLSALLCKGSQFSVLRRGQTRLETLVDPVLTSPASDRLVTDLEIVREAGNALSVREQIEDPCVETRPGSPVVPSTPPGVRHQNPETQTPWNPGHTKVSEHAGRSTPPTRRAAPGTGASLEPARRPSRLARRRCRSCRSGLSRRRRWRGGGFRPVCFARILAAASTPRARPSTRRRGTRSASSAGCVTRSQRCAGTRSK